MINKILVCGGINMMNVWRLEYFFSGDLAISVVIARTMKEAIDIIVDGDEVTEIEKCERMTEIGEVLTWYQD